MAIRIVLDRSRSTLGPCHRPGDDEARRLQATERRILLKLRDDQTIRHVVLIVADTKADRRALAVGRESLRGNFPLDTRAAMGNLSAGRCPGGNAIVLV